jgi:hypothetical protein
MSKTESTIQFSEIVEELKHKIKAIRHAYDQSQSDYHDWNWWEDEQWDRIKNAEATVLALVEALEAQFNFIVKQESHHKLRSALEFYAEHEVYYKCSQFPGDDSGYIECSDIAINALNANCSLELRQRLGPGLPTKVMEWFKDLERALENASDNEFRWNITDQSVIVDVFECATALCHTVFGHPSSRGKNVAKEESHPIAHPEHRLLKYKKALDLALYYVEGDSAYEALNRRIDDMLKDEPTWNHMLPNPDDLLNTTAESCRPKLAKSEDEPNFIQDQNWLGQQCYKGNSVGFIYDKMLARGVQIDRCLKRIAELESKVLEHKKYESEMAETKNSIAEGPLEIRINARRETALEDSDANLAHLLASCSERIAELEAKHEAGYVKVAELEAEIKRLHNKYDMQYLVKKNEELEAKLAKAREELWKHGRHTLECAQAEEDCDCFCGFSKALEEIDE